MVRFLNPVGEFKRELKSSQSKMDLKMGDIPILSRVINIFLTIMIVFKFDKSLLTESCFHWIFPKLDRRIRNENLNPHPIQLKYIFPAGRLLK